MNRLTKINVPRITRETFAMLALFLAVSSVVARGEGGYDLWWHVLLGERMLDTGSVFLSENFAGCGARSVWVNHEWASELLFAYSSRFWGKDGPAVLRAFIVALIFSVQYLVLRRRNVPAFHAVFLQVALLLPVISIFGNVRPQLFSILFFLILLSLLDGAKYSSLNKRTDDGRSFCPSNNSELTLVDRIPLLILLILWANFHGGVLLGGASLVIFEASRRSDRGILIGILVVLTALVSQPWGIEYFSYLYSELTSNHLHIGEWKPLTGAQWNVWAFFLLLLVIHYLSRKKGSWLTFLAAALAAYTTIHARMLPFFAIATITEAGLTLSHLFPIVSIRTKKVITCFFGLCIFAIARIPLNSIASEGITLVNDGQKLPVAALEWMGRNRIFEGVLVLPIEWGGFVLSESQKNKWGLQVAIDGRSFTAYDSAYVEQYLKAYVEADLVRLSSLCPAANLMLLPSKSTFAKVFDSQDIVSADESVRELYRDSESVLYELRYTRQ